MSVSPFPNSESIPRAPLFCLSYLGPCALCAPRAQGDAALFDLLGSDADTRKSQIAAFGTKRRGGAAKIAMMTTDAFLLLVKGKGHAAIGTAQHMTAKSALQIIRESSPVEKIRLCREA